jgi:tetratricopeptide (TPR) repeat protein
MRNMPTVLMLAVVSATALPAQKPEQVPKRPKLATSVDTNDVRAYLDLGIKMLEGDPDVAAAAFYWAARLNPAEAEAYYGRRSALILTNRRVLSTYIDGSRRDRQAMREFRALDSLQLRALLLNPFLYRRLENRLFNDYIRQLARQGPTSEQPTDADLLFEINTYLQHAGASTRAWVAYADGNFDDALREYAYAMKSEREKAPYRLERARIFGMRAQPDSAIAEFNLALEEMRKSDAKSIVYVYDSKAAIEHSIGMLLEARDRPSEAREAYGRALQEDIAFYPAHLRLGLLALTGKDTANAISELDLATQLAGSEPYVRYIYGFTLASAGHQDEALTQIAKAIELDPYYALPYLALAQLQEKKGDKAAARTAYHAFLDHASQQAPQRSDAEQRLLILASGSGGAEARR